MKIYTDAAGNIRDATADAMRLLGIRSPGATSIALPLFFIEHRHRIMEMMLIACGGCAIHFEAVLQGLQGGRRRVAVEIQRIGMARHDLLEWVFLTEPVTATH